MDSPAASSPGVARSLSSLLRPVAPSAMTSPLLSPSREQPSPWPAPSSPSVRSTPPTPSISKVPPLAPYLPSREAVAAMAAAHKRAVAAAQRRSAVVADHKSEKVAKQLPPATADPSGPSPQFVMQQQQLLAHMAMNVSAQPSPYLEAIMRRVADVESGIDGEAEGSDTQQQQQPEQQHASQHTQGSPPVRRPNALAPLRSPSPHSTTTSLQSLASLLSPAQADQLQLYPQLLVQAVAPSLSPASALSIPSASGLGRSPSVQDDLSGVQTGDAWAAGRSPSSSDEWSSPSSSPPARRPAVHRSKKSLLYGSLARVRSSSPQRGWDDSFGALIVLAAPTQGRPRDRGTFGAPPKLLPNLLTQEKERVNAERARVAKLNADRRERDRALERLERDRPPSPEKDWVGGKHSSRAVELVRSQLDRLAPTSPSHHATLLHEQMERDAAARPGSAGATFAHGSSPSQHQRHVTAGASFASPVDADRASAAEFDAESESAARLPCFTRAFLDSHGYSDQQDARRHLQHVSRLATSALRALHPADADQLPVDEEADTAPHSSSDVAQAVEQTLDSYLSYFEGTRDALPATAQHAHTAHEAEQHDSPRLRMYTASVAPSPGSVAPIEPVATPLLAAAEWSAVDAALLFSRTLSSKQWYLRGFDASQQPLIPFDDDLLEPTTRATPAASPLVSPVSPSASRLPAASRDLDARLHVSSLLPDAGRLGVSTAVFVAAAASHPTVPQVAIVDPGAALPQPQPARLQTDTEHTTSQREAAADGQGESSATPSTAPLAVAEPVPHAAQGQSELLDRALLSLFPFRLDSGVRAEFAPIAAAVSSAASDDLSSAVDPQRPICALLAQFRAEPVPLPPRPPTPPQPPAPQPTERPPALLSPGEQAGDEKAAEQPALAPAVAPALAPAPAPVAVASSSPVAAASPAPPSPQPLKSALKSSSSAAPASSADVPPASASTSASVSASAPLSVSFTPPSAAAAAPVDRKASVKAPATIAAAAAAVAPPSAAAPAKADRKASAPRFTLAPTVVASPSQRAALFSACRAGQHSAVALLLAGGVSVDEADEATGDRCIHMAIRNNDKKMFKICIKAGANINAQNLRGETVLHVCASLKLMDLGKYAISKGADSKMKNDAGLTWKQTI